MTAPTGIRTHDLWFYRQTPSPFGHGDSCSWWPTGKVQFLGPWITYLEESGRANATDKVSVVMFFTLYGLSLFFWHWVYLVPRSSISDPFLGSFWESPGLHATGGSRQTHISVHPRCAPTYFYTRLLVPSSSTPKSLGCRPSRQQTLRQCLKSGADQ